jgi:hypothetical protein
MVESLKIYIIINFKFYIISWNMCKLFQIFLLIKIKNRNNISNVFYFLFFLLLGENMMPPCFWMNRKTMRKFSKMACESHNWRQVRTSTRRSIFSHPDTSNEDFFWFQICIIRWSPNACMHTRGFSKLVMWNKLLIISCDFRPRQRWLLLKKIIFI